MYLVVEVGAAKLAKVAVGHALLADPHTQGVLPHPALVALDGEAVVILVLADTPDMIILEACIHR